MTATRGAGAAAMTAGEDLTFFAFFRVVVRTSVLHMRSRNALFSLPNRARDTSIRSPTPRRLKNVFVSALAQASMGAGFISWSRLETTLRSTEAFPIVRPHHATARASYT